MKYSLGISNFLEEISFPFYCFLLFLCTDHWGSLSYLSLLFFGTLHSNGYVFPFLLFLFLFFFSELFVRLSQTTVFTFCISFSGGWSWYPPPVQCHETPSIVLQALCLFSKVSDTWFHSSPLKPFSFNAHVMSPNLVEVIYQLSFL